MKNLLLELYALIKADEQLTLNYSQFIETVDHFIKYSTFPGLQSPEIVFVFLTEFCGFTHNERKFIESAENAREIYDFFVNQMEKNRFEHLAGGYEPSEGLAQ